MQSDVKVELNKTGRDCMEKIHLSHDWTMWMDDVNMVTKLLVSQKAWISYRLCNYQGLKKAYIPIQYTNEGITVKQKVKS